MKNGGRTRTTSGSRHGFTLTEIIIVVACVAVVLTVVATLMIHGRTRQERLTATASALQDARLAMSRMSREIREGYRVFYPAAGGKSQPGVGFINAKGKAIMYYIDAPSVTAPDDGKLYELKRVDLNENETKVVAKSVYLFRVTVPPVESGREPALVRLHLTTSTGATGRIQKHALQPLVTSVYVRAAETRCADWGPVQ